MYLKRVELKGFKSFPNKTIVDFKPGITAIVGPNGSGKSNISDAIRWVLGEQSIKNLRGEKLEDVIFSGTDNQNGMNFCEVNLIIDNLEKKMPIDFSEIAIKRKAYKSGESEFFINNKTCRLKDIKELLLDTGIGKEGYSIIEQGKVEDLISGNAQNRRKIFDEATGIAKYRYKKEETQKKLLKTKENIDRIDDIFSEIKKQIEPLKFQKNKAIEFLKFKEELKILEINQFLNEIVSLNPKIEKLELDLSSFKQSLNENENLILEKQEEFKNIENQIGKLSIILEELQNQKFEKHSKFEDCQHQIININEKIKSIQKSKSLLEEEIEAYKVKQEDILLKEKNIIFKITELETILKRLDETSLKQEKKVSFLKNEKEKKDQELEKNKQDLFEYLNQENDLKVKTSKLDTILDSLKERVLDIKVQIEKQLLLKKENEDSIKFFIADENKLRKELEICIRNEDDINKIIIEKEKNVKKIENKASELLFSKRDLESKLKIYKNMQEHMEGYSKSVKEILKNLKTDGLLGIFADIIKTDKKFENAIDVALGKSIENIITTNEIEAKKCIEFLKENNLGRATFVPLNVIEKKNYFSLQDKRENGFLGTGVELVQFDFKFRKLVEYMLSRVLIVKDIESAIYWSKKTNHKFKIVTLDAQIFNAGGSITGGSNAKFKNSLLQRKRLIFEIEEKLKYFEEEEENLKFQLEESKKEASVEIENLIQSQKTKNDLINKLNKIKTNLLLKNQELNSFLNNIEKLKKEESLLLENENESAKNRILYEKQQKNLKNLQIKLKENIEKLEKNYDNEIKNQDAENESLQRLYIEKTEKKANLNSCIEEKTRIQEEKIEVDNFLDQKLKMKMSIKNENENLEKKLYEIKLTKTQFLKEKELIEEQICSNDEKLERLKKSKEFVFKTIEDLTSNKETFISKIHKNELELDKFKINASNLKQRLWEAYELSVHEAMEFKENIIIDKQKINLLKESLKKIGNVNLNSIKEYKELKERFDFYDSQSKDLQNSINSLENLINQLEKNMKVEFLNEFNKINDKFKDMFKKLFRGGEANLEIENSQEILKSDILIKVKPPGKKMKTINLMSGGEKSLVAIAILFAILLTRPTPFCVLDEIEAALDDANIYRFSEFLKSISINTQFIAITHRLGTMESANHIYGVTMQEKGISKLISLKLEDAKEFSE